MATIIFAAFKKKKSQNVCQFLKLIKSSRYSLISNGGLYWGHKTANMWKVGDLPLTFYKQNCHKAGFALTL